ncbi:hypothetical protein AAG906_025090 [Vitis piasezkii]
MAKHSSTIEGIKWVNSRIWDSVLTLRGTMPPKHQASIPHNSEASPQPHLLNHKIQKVATSIKGERKNYSYFTPYLLCEPPVSPWIEAVMPKENLGGGSFIASVGAVAPHNHPLLQILVMMLIVRTPYVTIQSSSTRNPIARFSASPSRQSSSPLRHVVTVGFSWRTYEGDEDVHLRGMKTYKINQTVPMMMKHVHTQISITPGFA